MDAIVTARVPVELKEQGSTLLKEIGSTPTQLVNAAYRFLLKEKRLPHVDSSLEDMRGAQRTLTKEQKQEVKRALDAMYVGAQDEMSFEKALEAARDERYAAFA